MKEPLSSNKIRAPFIITMLAFCTVIFLGFYAIEKSESELRFYSNASLKLERVDSLVAQHLFFFENYLNSKNSNRLFDGKAIMDKISDNSIELKRTIENLSSMKSTPYSWVDSIKDIFFDSDYRLDEHLRHFIKISEKLRVEFKRSHLSTQARKLHGLLNNQGFLVRDVIDPVKVNLYQATEQIATINIGFLYCVNFCFLGLLSLVYFFIYKPWKMQFENIEREKIRLSSVLSESEVRGNTFSWELNYDTKESKRSGHLMGLFEMDTQEEAFFIYDEISLFDESSREAFEESLENCVLKGTDLDVKVNLLTKNRKNYWLHYYARPVHDGKNQLIVGTVRDITKQRLAEIRFESLFNHLSAPAIIFGEGHILQANRAALSFFGKTEEDQLQNLHPGILFPLYQYDGRSSFEMLSDALEEVEVGQAFTEDWSFKTDKGEEVIGKVSLFNVPYPEINQHMMVINDDIWRYEYERRLVEANRRAMHARRIKLEYITNIGVVIQNLAELVGEEINLLDTVDLEPSAKLKDIKLQLSHLWEENIDNNLEDGNNIVLTDLKALVNSMLVRWNSIANEQTVDFTLSFQEFSQDYFWIDGQKLKLAMIALVESSLRSSEGSKVSIDLKFNVKGPRQCLMDVTVYNSDPNWPGEDWKKLSFSTNASRGKDQHHLSLRKFLNVVELLQGEVYFDSDNSRGNSVGFKCYVEMAIGDIQDLRNQAKISHKSESMSFSSAEIWSHFGGDWDIIEATIKDFLDYYPIVLADLYYHLQSKDSDELYSSASDLYGVLTYFPFFSALERVVLIQKYSQYMKFEKIEKVLDELSNDLIKFEKALVEFVPQKSLKKVA